MAEESTGKQNFLFRREEMLVTEKMAAKLGIKPREQRHFCMFRKENKKNTAEVF